MRQFFLAGAVLFAAGSTGFAADFNAAFEPPAAGPAVGLVAGGIGSLYVGYLGYEGDEIDIDRQDQGIVGARAAYSLPLGSRFSAQFDLIGEVNVVGDDQDNDLTLGDYMGAVHIDARDPASYLFGAFLGAGQSFDDGDNEGDAIPFWFAGLEGQTYLGNLTLGGQLGYLDSEENNDESISSAWFARLVAAHYFKESTKLSGELAFLTGDRANGNPTGSMDVLSWGARLDHFFPNFPAGLMLAYNGFDYEGDEASDESDAPIVHEVRIGVTFLLGTGSLIENDRRAAGADLPPINRWISTSANEIE